MIAMTAISLQGIRRRLDAIAIDQLRAEVSRLAEENEELRKQLAWAEQAAEAWRDDALNFQMELCEHSGGTPGITQTGALVVVPPGGVA